MFIVIAIAKAYLALLLWNFIVFIFQKRHNKITSIIGLLLFAGTFIHYIHQAG